VKKIFVVDSSVAIKWYFPEIHKEAAERLLKPNYHLQFHICFYWNLLMSFAKSDDVVRSMPKKVILSLMKYNKSRLNGIMIALY